MIASVLQCCSSQLWTECQRAYQLRDKEDVYCVESYTIPYDSIAILRWRMLPAQKETTSYTRVYVQGSHWIGSIIRNSNSCDLLYLHWFLRGYLVTFKTSTQVEVAAYSMQECNYGMWCVLPHTWIMDLSPRYANPVWLYVVDNISDTLFSKLQHLASNVSHQYVMAYDAHPHQWRYVTHEKHAENALVIVRKTYLHDPGGHVRCKEVLLFISVRFGENRRNYVWSMFIL